MSAARALPVQEPAQPDRQRLYVWAEARGFPRLPLARHLAVMAGEPAWKAFTSGASRDDIAQGIAAIDAAETATTRGDERMPETPEPPVRRISHSQIEMFTQCSMRWKLAKIDRVPQAPASALILGDAVHIALESDGNEWIVNKRHLDYIALVAIFADALTARLAKDDPDGLLGERERHDLHRKGMAALSAYVEHLQSRYQPIAAERELETEVPDADGLRYIGRVDGMTQPAGTADTTIVDFKVISKPWRHGDEHLKDQASAYIWLANKVESEEGWECHPNRVTFITFPVLPTEDGEGYICTPDIRPTTRTTEQIAAYVAHVQAIAEAMEWARETGDFPAQTGPLCCWCSVLSHCDDGQAYVRQSGRKVMVPLVQRQVTTLE